MGLGGIGFGELLILLVIVLLIFGGKRLSTIGSDLGSAIKGFRRAVSDGNEAPPVPDLVPQPAPREAASRTDDPRDDRSRP